MYLTDDRDLPLEDQRALAEGLRREPSSSIDELETELRAWRNHFPESRYSFGEILPNIE
jgi:hypothetical protein